MEYEIIITNGHILDGTGNPWFKADIGIAEGRITEISRTPLKNADKTIDASGLIVCPGFVNLHSHSDSGILFHNKAENCLAMGLVTELVGNCGSSVAPITESYREFVLKKLKRRSFSLEYDEKIDWLSLGDWMKKLEDKGIGINIASLVGHGSIRSCAMGEEGHGGERIVPTADEMKKMKSLLDAAMKEGAFGFSVGLSYAPGRNALTGEMIELAKVVAKYGGLHSSHMRCEGLNLIEATNEFIEVCETAGIRGTIAHHKASGSNNFGKASETIRIVERARARGVDIVIDQYPWRHGGVTKSLGGRFTWDDPTITREELVEKLKDAEECAKIKEAFLTRRKTEIDSYKVRKEQLEELGGWAPVPYAMEIGGTIIYSKTHPELEGKTFKDVAEHFEKKDILDGIIALLIEDDGWTCAGGEPYSEDDIITIMKYPWTTPSTDQYAFDASKISLQETADNLAMQHPRGWGTYPKILGKYVREEGILTIEEAIRKMTSLPAGFLGLQDRGIVRKGFYADLVIFDPDTIGSTATYENPLSSPTGIPYVLVNGKVAIDKGKRTETLSGKVLRNT